VGGERRVRRQKRIFAAPFGKPRALLMTTSSAGLRVSEVVRLRVTDIDSQSPQPAAQEVRSR
jgi:hypothetical protein